MHLINEAFAVLSDPSKRQEYDTQRHSSGGTEAASGQSAATTEQKHSTSESGSRTGARQCWTCKKDPANGKPATVHLSLITGKSRDWFGDVTSFHFISTSIDIPRCHHCERKHVNRSKLIKVPAVLGGLFLLLAALLNRLMSESPAVPITAFSGGITFILGIVWMQSAERSWFQRTFALYPPVQELLKARWLFGKVS
jgi:hypothetical protein